MQSLTSLHIRIVSFYLLADVNGVHLNFATSGNVYIYFVPLFY